MLSSLSLPTPAQAFLIDRGDHTQDARTGLRWLDVTESRNISYNTMVGLMGPGGAFEDYRHASEPETLDFFRSAGVRGIPFFQLFLTQSEMRPLRELEALVGVTVTSSCCGFVRTGVNGSDPTAFPTFLAFDQPTVSFKMKPLGILIETTTTSLSIPTTTLLPSTTSTQFPTTTTPVVFECGDANQDGSSSAADALFALRAAVELISCDLLLCDASGNGSVTAQDALRILQRAVGIEVTMLCGGM
jgi:hypothetical protein